MKTVHQFRLPLFVLFIVASSILGCAPRRVIVVEQRPRPAKVVVVKHPAHRMHPHPHRVVVVRRR